MVNSARCVIRIVLVACTVGATALLAPSASDAQVNTCNLSPLSKPFEPWLDLADYELVPGGDFESSTWTLTGGAAFVAGSEPYAATSTLGSSSLSLPPASSAQSPLTCIDATHPSIRAFIAGTGSVAVDVVDGSSVIPAGVAVAGHEWSPTPVMLTSSAVLSAVSGGTAQVSLTFAEVSGSPRIDDVFIDPWNRG